MPTRRLAIERITRSTNAIASREARNARPSVENVLGQPIDAPSAKIAERVRSAVLPRAGEKSNHPRVAQPPRSPASATPITICSIRIETANGPSQNNASKRKQLLERVIEYAQHSA